MFLRFYYRHLNVLFCHIPYQIASSEKKIPKDTLQLLSWANNEDDVQSVVTALTQVKECAIKLGPGLKDVKHLNALNKMKATIVQQTNVKDMDAFYKKYSTANGDRLDALCCELEKRARFESWDSRNYKAESNLKITRHVRTLQLEKSRLESQVAAVKTLMSEKGYLQVKMSDSPCVFSITKLVKQI